MLQKYTLTYSVFQLIIVQIFKKELGRTLLHSNISYLDVLECAIAIWLYDLKFR